jgi:peptidylprolyl isomerase
MAKAKRGDTVRVIYTGKLEDGEIVDSSEECDDEGCECDAGPLEFNIGEEDVIPGLEEAVIGMGPGETKTVNIPADQAYGPRDDEMIFLVDRSDIPEDLNPEIGQILEITDDDGEVFSVVVTDVSETSITIDANHPLAGHNMVYDIELVEVL